MTLNDADRVATLTRLHDAYEQALAANDVEALNAFFWTSPLVVRYGVAEQLYGVEELRAYRQGHTPPFTSRRLTRRVITVFGTSHATVMAEIEVVSAGVPRTVRQSQTWVCLPKEGWRIVAAHVSRPLQAAPAGAPDWGAYVDATARTLELPVSAAHRPAVIANLERTAAIAASLLAFPVPADTETAPVFQP
jgi:1,6-anhydro-N-acetylmuramate kinase